MNISTCLPHQLVCVFICKINPKQTDRERESEMYGKPPFTFHFHFHFVSISVCSRHFCDFESFRKVATHSKRKRTNERNISRYTVFSATPRHSTNGNRIISNCCKYGAKPVLENHHRQRANNDYESE